MGKKKQTKNRKFMCVGYKSRSSMYTAFKKKTGNGIILAIVPFAEATAVRNDK